MHTDNMMDERTDGPTHFSWSAPLQHTNTDEKNVLLGCKAVDYTNLRATEGKDCLAAPRARRTAT